MQDLTQKFVNVALLTPTSQEGGNMVQPDLAQKAMTAPGTVPASPNPGPFTGEHLNPQQSGETMPVSAPGNKPRVPAGTSPGGQWADVNRLPGALWKQTQ